jgi:hypothetical protein
LLELRKTHPNLDSKTTQEWLDHNRITLNRNTIPSETRSPFLTSGLRIGTPALTTRGMKEPEMLLVADMIDQTLNDPNKKTFDPYLLKSCSVMPSILLALLEKTQNFGSFCFSLSRKAITYVESTLSLFAPKSKQKCFEIPSFASFLIFFKKVLLKGICYFQI